MIQLLSRHREATLLLVLVVLFTGFALTTKNFLDWFGLAEQTRYLIVPGMLAIPMTFIIATAGIDLSVGSIVAMCGIVLGLLYRDAQWPIALACLASVIAGLLAGTFNGAMSSYLRIPPLVVTLATMTLYRGIATGLSRAKPINQFPDGFVHLSNGDLIATANNAFYLPFPILPLVIVSIVGWLLMRKSWVGRFTEHIGENETAAIFAAIPVAHLKCALYAVCGLVCGMGAIFNVALYSTAKSNAAMGYELEAIACVVLGGTRISGGKGSIPGSLLGLLIIGILRYGLDLAGFESKFVIIVVGILLIVTVVFNEWLARQGEQQK